MVTQWPCDCTLQAPKSHGGLPPVQGQPKGSWAIKRNGPLYQRNVFDLKEYRFFLKLYSFTINRQLYAKSMECHCILTWGGGAYNRRALVWSEINYSKVPRNNGIYIWKQYLKDNSMEAKVHFKLSKVTNLQSKVLSTLIPRSCKQAPENGVVTRVSPLRRPTSCKRANDFLK